jgi:hypothetical protein
MPGASARIVLADRLSGRVIRYQKPERLNPSSNESNPRRKNEAYSQQPAVDLGFLQLLLGI